MNDASYEALMMMIEMANNTNQKNALHAALDMLCDIWDDKWYSSTDAEKKTFVQSFMVSNFVL